MAKKIIFSNDLKDKILEGVKILYDTVRFTLGPKGRNVIISEDYGAPLIINDGATIVVEHKLANDLQNLPECYIIKKSRKYGIAYIDILEFTE